MEFLVMVLFIALLPYKVFLDEPAAKVYLLDDFATDAECKALMDSAKPNLQVFHTRTVLHSGASVRAFACAP